MDIETRPFGRLPDGRTVERVDLSAGAVSASILTYGGIIASFQGPNTRGDLADITLGFDDLAGWLEDPQYIGALVGRFANRIRGARFTLDGEDVHITRNRGDHHLHGGRIGFDKVIWEAEPFSRADRVGVVLSHHSPEGTEGFPGSMDVGVTYSLTADGSLTLEYTATTDRPTVVNLTNHVYFNLAGSGSILDHEVTLHAARFLPVDDATLPTGDIASVAATPMDFTSSRIVGDRIDADDEQLRLAGGYDHCWVIDGKPGELRRCARVVAAGRRLDVRTTQPGVQFYSGNAIRPRVGRGGERYGPHSGLCLETQHFPDSPNHARFPSTRLDPGERFSETTVYRLGAA
jgi:aldose 1-epimerase